MKQIHHFINGSFVPSARSFAKRSPLDGSIIAQVHEGSAQEVDQAVAAARAALHGPWGQMSLAERADRLYAVADGITRRFDEFLEAECADTGKPQSLARR